MSFDVNVKSRLYYEAHITVEAGDDWDTFANRARVAGWRASKFDEDEVDDMSGKWFLSYRCEKLKDILFHVELMLDLVGCTNTILRWKIEDTLFDSKHGDDIAAIARGN